MDCSTGSTPPSRATSRTKSTSSTACWNRRPNWGRGSRTAPISMSAGTPNGWRATSIAASPISSPRKAAWTWPAAKPTSLASPATDATFGTSIDRRRAAQQPERAIDNDQPMTDTLKGLRIALLETREADRLAAMLREEGAEIVACPAVAIVHPADPAPALAWRGRVIAAPFDDLILLTGEGLHKLRDLARLAGIEAAFLAALGRT